MRTLRRQSRVFGKLLALNLITSFNYRGEMLLRQIGNLLVPLISLFVWQAALASGAQLPTSERYLTSYFVLVAVINMLSQTWGAFYLAEGIRDGSLNRYLVRPLSTHVNGLANNVGEKLVKFAVLAPMVALLALVLGDRFAFPAGLSHWLLAAVSLIMAGLMSFLFDIVLGGLGFWFDDVAGFLRARAVIIPLLSGAVVPLELMPDELAGVTLIQPFRYLVSFPLEVLLGDVSGGLLAGFGLQAGWLIIFAAGAALVWRLGIRTYSGAGA
jgi:ABC-2 type transport system permease protein